MRINVGWGPGGGGGDSHMEQTEPLKETIWAWFKQILTPNAINKPS